MKSISIRELHARTGRWVRDAALHGQIVVKDHGRAIARILPQGEPAKIPYFARRELPNRALGKRIESGKLGCGGTDITAVISEDRQDRA